MKLLSAEVNRSVIVDPTVQGGAAAATRGDNSRTAHTPAFLDSTNQPPGAEFHKPCIQG